MSTEECFLQHVQVHSFVLSERGRGTQAEVDEDTLVLIVPLHGQDVGGGQVSVDDVTVVQEPHCVAYLVTQVAY